ncbi:MAG: phosphatidylserine decarboxylase family protein, partial [Gemmatimonadetes bacterium]|nr:phosphatidylserine decarboxylase family protein [Gemmatimonadota bacterium]
TTRMSIAREGYAFIAAGTALALTAFVLAALAGSWSLWLAAYGMVVLTIFLTFFFRDPAREGERGEHLILAPADGRIVQIIDVHEPAYLGGAARRISIFLSLFDVHVQRAPVSGMVGYRHYQPGRYLAAWRERASTENEQSSVGIDNGRFKVLVRQIAGLVAQRIVTDVRRGDDVVQGQRIGLIRFGSRVDLYLPLTARLRVRAGDRARAGQTVLAELPPREAP